MVVGSRWSRRASKQSDPLRPVYSLVGTSDFVCGPIGQGGTHISHTATLAAAPTEGLMSPFVHPFAIYLSDRFLVAHRDLRAWLITHVVGRITFAFCAPMQKPRTFRYF